MGTEIFSLEGDRKNPLVTGVGFILTILYAFFITSYLEAVGQFFILSDPGIFEAIVIGIVALATTGYLIFFAVENYLWTEQYERSITVSEYGDVLKQHTLHIGGTLLLLGFAYSQTILLPESPEESINIFLFLTVPLSALTFRYLFFALWQFISLQRTVPNEDDYLETIHSWSSDPEFLQHEHRYVINYSDRVERLLSGWDDDQNPTELSEKDKNSIRNSACSLPWYLLMIVIHPIIPILLYLGWLPFNIGVLLFIPILIIFFIIPYYIIWRPFYFELHNVNTPQDNQ